MGNSLISIVKVGSRAIHSKLRNGSIKYVPNNLDGCILYLPMEEKTINLSLDHSGHNHHGTIYGANEVAGKVGKGLSFDGIDDYVKVGDIGSVSSYTVTFWAKRSTAIGSYDVVFSCAPLYKDSMWIYENGDIGYGDAGSGWAKWNNIWTDKSEFHQIAVVIPNVGIGQIVTLYFDGQIIGNINTKTYGILNDVTLGRYPQGVMYFDGVLDEFKIYNRVLTEHEIFAQYEQEK